MRSMLTLGRTLTWTSPAATTPMTLPAATSQMPGVAVRFVDFLLDPEIAALNANELRFATPNLAAITRGLVADASDPALYPSPETRKKLFVSEQWFGQTEAVVDALWLELRSA